MFFVFHWQVRASKLVAAKLGKREWQDTNHQPLFVRAIIENPHCFVTIQFLFPTLYGVSHRNYRELGGREPSNRPQKRVFREKLTLDTHSGHKGRQPRLHLLDIGSIQIQPNSSGFVEDWTTFLEKQTLKTYSGVPGNLGTSGLPVFPPCSQP